MAAKKIERKDFFKYMAGVLSNTGFKLVDSVYKEFEQKLQGGVWVKAVDAGATSALPRLLLIKGYWVFIDKRGERAFKALCPYDNSFLQYRSPEDNLFCIRCSRCYCPSTGNCINVEATQQDALNLYDLPLRKTEGGIFVYLEK